MPKDGRQIFAPAISAFPLALRSYFAKSREWRVGKEFQAYVKEGQLDNDSVMKESYQAFAPHQINLPVQTLAEKFTFC